MTDSSKPARWHTHPDADAVATAAANRILQSATDAIARSGQFRIVLAGGRTPEKAYRLLADADTDWRCWEIYYGDERCLPADHEERNSVMAREAWLDHVPLPPERHHPIPAECGARQAAQSYRDTIATALPFDLVLLGIGEDGHTASLFPGQSHPPAELVHPVHQAPKPPPERVSLGERALNDSREILVLVTGAGKRKAVQAWKQGDALPVSRIHGLHGADVLIDTAAAQ